MSRSVAYRAVLEGGPCDGRVIEQAAEIPTVFFVNGFGDGSLYRRSNRYHPEADAFVWYWYPASPNYT